MAILLANVLFITATFSKSPRATRGPLSIRGLLGPLLYQRRDREDFASSIAWLAHSKNSSSWYRQLKIALGLSTLFGLTTLVDTPLKDSFLLAF